MALVRGGQHADTERQGSAGPGGSGDDRGGGTREPVAVDIARDLAARVNVVRAAWNDFAAGSERTPYDVAVLRWVQDMYAYYHAGGKGCVLIAGGLEGRCGVLTKRLPLCWSCAGGAGLPPEPETIDLSANEAYGPKVDALAFPPTHDKTALYGVSAQSKREVKDDRIVGPSAGVGDRATGGLGGGQPDERQVLASEVRGSRAEGGEEAGGPGGGVQEVDEREVKGGLLESSGGMGRRVPAGLGDIAPGDGPEEAQEVDEKAQQAADIVKDIDRTTTLVVRISGIGHCRRQMAYGWLGYDVTDPPKPAWRRAARLGDVAEPILVDYLTQEQGYGVINALQHQRTVEWAWPQGGLVFRGHPDGDVTIMNNVGVDMNLELKALKHERAAAIADQSVGNVVPAYVSQAHGYMRAKNQQATLFAVLDRDTGEVHEQVVEFDRAHWKDLVDRWREVAPIILAGELPERDGTKGSFQCNVCQYKTVCWDKTS